MAGAWLVQLAPDAAVQLSASPRALDWLASSVSGHVAFVFFVLLEPLVEMLETKWIQMTIQGHNLRIALQ